jgi:pyruvate dehydrogenase E2 component (dihydrolipoamide acetyltransferase)
MGSRVVMPKLTDTMEEGVVVKWKKQEGEAVAAGDVLAEIETDKAVMDLEAFASGVLRRVLAAEGETVKAGALIGVIGEPDEDIAPLLSDQAAPAAAAPAPRPPSRDQAEPAVPAPSAKTDKAAASKEGVKASPRARTLARERGIDLSAVTGSGPDGRIVEEDIVKVAGSRPTQPGRVIERPLSQMRKAIARTTTQSKGPVPHFYVTTDIDMEEADRFRHQFRQLRPNPPGVNDMIVKAAALALLRHPEINASFAGDAIHQHASIDIGIAVGLDDGLISPVLRDCGSKSLLEISEQAHALIDRARNRQLRPEEYSEATFSVSNLGMFDVENFIAILMPPEAAALAVGSIREVPVADGDRVRVGRQMKVTLSCDHRVIDGIQAAKFLKEFKRILEHPLDLMLPQEGKPEA